MSNPFAKPDLPPPPVPKPPPEMPDPNNPAVVEAKRRATADALNRGGRQSTILTGALGNQNASGLGQAYDNFAGKKLGGA